MATTTLMEQDYDFQELQRRVLADFNEMPGLVLTYEQAVRLWACHPARCRAVLEALVESRFLVRNRRAAFVRREH
jgi:hypothetical protein